MVGAADRRRSGGKTAAILLLSCLMQAMLLARASPMPHRPAYNLGKRAGTALPAGWSVSGCKADGATLAMATQLSRDVDSAAECLSTAQVAGYRYAGLEYGGQCWASNTAPTTASSTSCTMTCSDGSACGGWQAMTVYSFAASAVQLPTGWSDYGCFADSTSQRVLPYSLSSSMPSASSCASACLAAGYSVAGVESGNQCFCGNTQPITTSTKCTTACQSGGGLCGGSSAISVYAADKSISTRGIAGPARSGYEYAGCFADSSVHVMAQMVQTVNSVAWCTQACYARGYSVAGLEAGTQCWCANSVPTTTSTSCTISCSGGSGTCGGNLALDVYVATITVPSVSTTTASSTKASTTTTKVSTITKATTTTAATSTTSKVSSTTKPVSTTAASSTTSKASTTTSSAIPTATASQAALANLAMPKSSSKKQVFAHFMVGNSYSYTIQDWASDIATAKAAGIDGFVLNLGSDYWENARIADAYSAATGTGFKMLLSFDMTSLPCGSDADAANLRTLTASYWKHPAQATTANGSMLVSTFGGEYCQFGESSVSTGWMKHYVTPVKTSNISMMFIPSIFTDPSTFSTTPWLDGEVNWNSGWPQAGPAPLSTASDDRYIAGLGGKAYVATASPAFFTMLPQWNKDFMWSPDQWLLPNRLQAINSMRDQTDMIELLTWNDFGESSYLGEVTQNIPTGSGNYVNVFPHTAFLKYILPYYLTGFKTGSYPAITKDSITVWSRPHSAYATASNPTDSKPTGWQYTEDAAWATVFVTAPSTVTLSSGNNSKTFNVPAGVTGLSVPSAPGVIKATMTRSGATVASVDTTGTFAWTQNTIDWNFNIFAQAS